LVEPPFPDSPNNAQPKEQTIHQLLNAILGVIGRTQGGTAAKFRAFQSLHLNQSLNKYQGFLTANARKSDHEWTQMDANERA